MRQLARSIVDHVTTAIAATARDFGDGEKRLLGGVTEDREDRHAWAEIDGIVTPFARSYSQAVEIEQTRQFLSIEGYNAAPGPVVGQTIQVGHAAASRFIACWGIVAEAPASVKRHEFALTGGLPKLRQGAMNRRQVR